MRSDTHLPTPPAIKSSRPTDTLVLRCQQSTELAEAYAAESRRSLTSCSDFDRPFVEEASALFDRFVALGRRVTDLAERIAQQPLPLAK